jgi:hypothetical protein
MLPILGFSTVHSIVKNCSVTIKQKRCRALNFATRHIPNPAIKFLKKQKENHMEGNEWIHKLT